MASAEAAPVAAERIVERHLLSLHDRDDLIGAAMAQCGGAPSPNNSNGVFGKLFRTRRPDETRPHVDEAVRIASTQLPPQHTQRLEVERVLREVR